MNALLTYTPPEKRIPLSAFPHVYLAPRSITNVGRRPIAKRKTPKSREMQMWCVFGSAPTPTGFTSIGRVIVCALGKRQAIREIRRRLSEQHPGLRFKLATFEIEERLMRMVLESEASV